MATARTLVLGAGLGDGLTLGVAEGEGVHAVVGEGCDGDPAGLG
jgi:hypothetical protein